MTWANGEIPLGLLVKVGEQQYLTPGTAARWAWMVQAGLDKYGARLRISPGWNGYRPLNIQIEYRAELGIMAAVPRYSSHGGTYNGRECMAIDVYNWRDLAPGNESLAWARFVALCRLAGFTVDFVTPRELWHIGDFDPWNIPAWLAEQLEGFLMALNDDEQRELLSGIRGLLSSQNQIDMFNNVSAIRARVNGDLSSQDQVDQFNDVKAIRDRVEFMFARWATADVNEKELAAEIVPLLVPLFAGHLGALSVDDLAQIGRAAADEQDRRARERLAS